MKKTLFSREKMLELNIVTLNERGVTVDDIAKVAHSQQSRYNKNIPFELAVQSVTKLLSYRDIFHHIQLGAEIDRLTEEGMFREPILSILATDLGVFGVDEVVGLDIASHFGTIGKTNFGDIDVNKPGIVDKLNEDGKKEGMCHTFMDDIVGAIAAAASTRIAQVLSEKESINND